MKRTGILAIALVVVLSITSCYWMGGFSTGGISMDFSQFQPRASGDVVRVYLIANGLLFSTGSNVPFTAEVPLAVGDAETIIKIDGLPVGPIYQAMIGVGPITNGIFQPRAYGETKEFQITSGDDTSITPTIDYLDYFYGISFSTDLKGKNLVDVVAGSYYVYAAEERQIHPVDDTGNLLDSYDLGTDPDNFGVGSHRINGLSPDTNNSFGDVLINSNKGVVPFDYYVEGWYFDPTFSSALGGDRSIADSGIITLGSDLALFFRRSEGIGGVYIYTGSIQDTWINLDVAGVKDIVLSNTNAYFATDGGSFALPWDFLLDSSPKFAEKRMNFSGPAKILSLGYVPIGGAPDRLMMGTTNGVWDAELANESPVTIGTLSQIPETAGDSIEMIETSNYNPSWFQAYLSRYFLYVSKYGSVNRYPFFAVLPGKVTGMTWNSDIDAKLYISGTEGLSVLHLGS
jgi:hypothetical protein